MRQDTWQGSVLRRQSSPNTGSESVMLICRNGDNAIRWKPGERLDHLFEQRCDELHASRDKPLAVVTEQAALTFRELDGRANQGPRYLVDQGIKSGDRRAVLFCKGCNSYL